MNGQRDASLEAALQNVDGIRELVAAAAAAGASITFSMSICPGEGERPSIPAASGEEERRDEAGGGNMHFVGVAAEGAIKELFRLGQRVAVPHLQIEGVISGITDWLENEPDFHVRWNDNECRARGGWFMRQEIQSLPDHIAR